MSQESSVLNVDSIPTHPNGMMPKLESSGTLPSSSVILVDNASTLSVGMDSKETLSVTGVADKQINFGHGYNGQPVKVKSNPASENREQLLNSGIAYLQRCNGVSGRRVDSPKRQTEQNQTNRWWPSWNSQLDGLKQSVGRTSKLTEPRTNPDVTHSCRNGVKWTTSSAKRNHSRVAQKSNTGEKKSVKILQRPSSATRILGHDVVEQGNREENASAATHQKKGRKKTLSLNPDELEDLEILIEQVLKDGIEETNTDSEDDDDDDEVTETVTCNGGVNEECKASPEKLAVIRNSDKTDRETRRDMSKNAVIRNETGAKGRKFVKETGKNTGRGRDQGRQRENSRTKDNHRSGNFQPCGVNEVSPPAPGTLDDERVNQNMTNVYPAQLKVALKHMDSLPPRFQRRLQTGMNQISGSDPSLSKRMEEVSPPKDSRHLSSYGSKDGEKSREVRERGSKKTIRNLLNDLALYDEETMFPTSNLFQRRLSYSSGSLSETGKPNLLNTINDASLQISSLSANGSSVDLSDTSRRMSVGDPFRLRPAPPFFHQNPVEKMFMVNGSYTADPLSDDSSTGYGKDFARWHQDRLATAGVLLPTPLKTTFSVNAPEFVSAFSSSNPAMDGDSSGGQTISGSLEDVDSLGFTDDANQMIANHPLPSNVINYQNDFIQSEYANTSVAGQQPQFPIMAGMPFTDGRNMAVDASFGPMPPSGANFPPRQGPVGMNMVPYTSVPMQYDTSGRGYVAQPQVLVSMMSNQPFVGAASAHTVDQQMTNASNGLTSNQWYAGGTQGSYTNTPSNQLGAGMGLMAHGSAPFGGQMGPDGVDGWPLKAVFQHPLPFDIGRQRIMKLMSEGNYVMVLLVGHVDGNKLSMFSELNSNGTGSFIPNLRNGICPLSEEKILELQQWNYKQALEAIEAQKNPIVIDLSYAQLWQLRDYFGLAQMSNYLVEIVSCDDGSQFRGIPNVGSCVWDKWQPNQPLAVDESATSEISSYNIPPVMDGVYCSPSASTLSSLTSQQQPPLVAHGDQLASSSSMQNVSCPVPNM